MSILGFHFGMLLMLLIFIFLCFVLESQSFLFEPFSGRHQSVLVIKRQAATFGDKIDFRCKLPTRDDRLANRFILCPDALENIWDKTKIRKTQPGSYILQLMIIPIPGIDIIQPEIELTVDNVGGLVYLSSDKLVLKSGKDGAFKNPSTVLGDIHFSLNGELKTVQQYCTPYRSNIKATGSTNQVMVQGYINYDMKIGKMLNAAAAATGSAPTANLSAAIMHAGNYARKSAEVFLKDRLPAKLSKAFKAFTRSLLANEESGDFIM